MTIDEQILKLNSSVWCKLASSPIHGIGVFAIRDILRGTKMWEWMRSWYDPRGSQLWEWSGMWYNVPLERFGEIHPAIRDLILDRHPMPQGGRSFVSPNDEANLQSFLNHSSSPNCRINIALRDIQKGEEITEDYRDLGIEFDKIQKVHYSFLVNLV